MFVLVFLLSVLWRQRSCFGPIPHPGSDNIGLIYNFRNKFKLNGSQDLIRKAAAADDEYFNIT
jgi:hypothetical protein